MALITNDNGNILINLSQIKNNFWRRFWICLTLPLVLVLSTGLYLAAMVYGFGKYMWRIIEASIKIW
jgi:hypothetical protein